MTGGTLTTGGWYVGHDHAGTINLSGGTLNASGDQMLFGWTVSSSLNVSGGILNMTGSGIYNIGHSAQSFMNITGGTANFSGGISFLNASELNVAGSSATLNVNGGTLSLVAASVNLSNNSTANISGAGTLVAVSGTNTTLNISNATLDVGAGAGLRVNTGGQINLRAGTAVVQTNEGLWLGSGGTTGTLNLSGGTWQQNGYMRMGVFASGNGVINQSGGVFEMGGTFEVWGDAQSQYNLQGGTFRVTAAGVAMNNFAGGMAFNISGSSGNVTMDLPFNFLVNNTSIFNNGSATLTKTGGGTLTFAAAGSQLDVRNGTLDLQDGMIETTSSLVIGSGGGTAAATVSGGTLKTGRLEAANLIVGYEGTGSLSQSNGTVDVGPLASAVFGWNAGGAGTYTLAGGNFSAVSNNTYIGLAGGTGTVNVNGGTFSAHNLSVGGNGAAAGTLNLNGGSFGVAGTFTVAAAGTVNLNAGGVMPAVNVTVGDGGLFNFNGGTGNAAMNLFIGGTVDVKGQTLGAGTWANAIASAPGAVLRNSGSNAATIANGNTIWIWDGGQNLTIDTGGGDIQIASLITSAGQTTPTGLIKTGTNALVLSGISDYTGTTVVNAGILTVDGNNAASTGAVEIASGATLGGSGVIGGATTINGRHSPGTSPGIQTFNNGLTYNTGSAFVWDLTANTLAGRGTVFDGVNVTGGTLSINTGVTSELVFNVAESSVNWSDAFWGDNRQWLVFDNASSPTLGSANVFDTLNVGLDSASQSLTSVRTGSSFSWEQIDNDVYLNYTIPEPSTYALLALGAAALGAHLWRRRNNQSSLPATVLSRPASLDESSRG
jgi:autotransporter-associated beta strand protein